MIIGSIYIVFAGADFFGPFQAFLITLGVPIAAWCGVFLADLVLRRRDYDQEALYDARGRYGSVGWVAVVVMLLGTVLGWGLVTRATARSTSLGGLPARPPRPRRQDRLLGLHRARRAGRAGRRLRRYLLLGAVRVRSQERV